MQLAKTGQKSYKELQRVTKGYNKLQRVTRGDKGLPGVRSSYKAGHRALPGVTGVTKRYKGLKGATSS